jgi:rfaE bifunctional protein kinase chain/domain
MTVSQILDRITGLKALVIGDLMLDEYIDGSATRISPEAPVMVIRQKGRRAVPGGAANVARNAAALGAQVTIVGLVGRDKAGEELKELLSAFHGCTPHLIVDSERATTTKTRVLAGAGHQVLRIDQEDTHPARGSAKEELESAVYRLSRESDVVILSDYAKGALGPDLLRSLGAPFVSVNAKPTTAPLYRSLSLMSLNRSEMEGLVGRDPRDLTGALAAAHEAREMTGVGCVLATMGDQGLAAAWDGGGCTQTAPRVEVSDVAGAGDTVIAAASLGAVAAGFHPSVFRLAVEASARVVRHSGVVAVSPEEVAELRTLD